MSPTVPFSCLLTLWVAGLGRGTRAAFGSQHPSPQPLELKEAFTLFQIQYNRTYSDPAEYARRLEVFAHNLAEAQRLQEENLGTAEFGVTQFSDLTEEEFGQLHRGAARGAPNVSRLVGSQEWGRSTPSSCDWRKTNFLSPVKDQGSCGCCWAIAAAGNIEAQWGAHVKQPVEVSVQELLDCDRCGDGCAGGWVWDAFITCLSKRGLASERDYPFKGNVKHERCKANGHKPRVAYIQGFVMLPDKKNERKMAHYVATQGPITVTINSKLLQHYRGGVLKASSTDCDPDYLDHSVLLVGFGRQAVGASPQRHSTPYWILKNSWGAQWGEKGYFRLHRGTNTCGITKYPITALVTNETNKQQVFCPP